MKKIIALLLLALLPLQSAWALAAEYCGEDEAMTQASHFGHHDHEDDHAAAPVSTSDAPDAESCGHADCGLCQLAHGYALAHSVVTAFGTGTGLARQPAANLLPSALTARPERPQWLSPV
jgi:hypothetical protein